MAHYVSLPCDSPMEASSLRLAGCSNWRARTRNDYDAVYGPWPGTRPSARRMALGPYICNAAPTPGAHFEPEAGSKAHPSMGLKRAWQTRGRCGLLTQLNGQGLIA